MAVVGKSGLGRFFIYDHNKLKKEEDDLIDAIVYFYPVTVSADEQCSLCGQLMGMSEFLSATISKSKPSFFKLHNEKYCLKRIGDFTMGLEGSLSESDYHIKLQLNFLYNSFVMFCGSFQNIYQQFVHNPDGFAPELRKIWNILYPLGCFNNNYISQVFQVMPMINLPKSSSDLFCQAADILQASQRRPGVHVGAILYKNKVLCTQMPADLTRKLALVQPELPCIQLKTDYDISRSIRLITVYLTKEEMRSIDQSFKPSDRHNHASQFVWSERSVQKPSLTRSRSSISPMLRYGQMMESIPERHPLELGLSAEIGMDEPKSVTNNLIWTSHGEPELLEISEPSKSKKDEKYETISDLEESTKRNDVKIQQWTVDSSALSNDFDNQDKIQSNTGSSSTTMQTNGDLNITIEADVHKDYSESQDSVKCIIKDNSQEGDQNTDMADSVIEKNSVITDSSDQSNTQEDEIHLTYSTGTHSNTHVAMPSEGSGDSNGIPTKIHGAWPSHGSVIKDDTNLSADNQKQLTDGNQSSIDSCHNCSSDHKSTSKKDTLVNTDRTVKKGHDSMSESGDSRTSSSKSRERKGSTDIGSVDDDVFIRVPQFDVDIDGVNVIAEIVNPVTDSDQEKGLLSPLGSEDSGSVDGSVSDVASLSNSRRKERFDFHSSADESSSEYGSFMSKRGSFDSTSGRKMPKIFRSKENESFDSSDYSLQSTLQSSGTMSLQSSGNGNSLGQDEFSDNYWVPEKDMLYEMTLYIQGQAANLSSDITMLLLLDNSVREDKSIIHSLWKDALPQLADLDFYVKESVDQHVDEGFMETSSYLKYDTLFQRIEGNEMDVPVNEDFQKLSGEIHKDYQLNKDFTSMALTSHLCSCNSSRDKTNELYYHVDGPNTSKQ